MTLQPSVISLKAHMTPSSTAMDHPFRSPITHAASEAASKYSIRTHAMPFGAAVQLNGGVRFRLWAPGSKSVGVKLDGAEEVLDLAGQTEGWHELLTDRARIGSLYQFVLGDGSLVPDPASRFQPQDVKGPSEVISPGSYLWQDGEWEGRPWAEAVVYELHIGTFTEEGTFRSAIEKFDHLRDLGITAIEIMPIGDFPGSWNWGYDGVLLFAPDSSYGRPEDLKALVEAAHARGIMVILDVVYNHFGPEGNYLKVYAPQTFTSKHKTPWGDAINYDGEGSKVVREFGIHNALYWLEEFHLDGLRLDAVHQIKDDGPKHLLDEIAERVRKMEWVRPIHLILENEENQASRLKSGRDGEPLTYTAQWNDDVHHVLHTAVTWEDRGYYGDYAGETEKLGRALAEGFAFQGEVMKCTQKHRGESSRDLPPTAFVAFIQNHDQIGNRAFGDRITRIASIPAVRAIASIYLLLPQIPMLFMGEEWASSEPFPFFCDFGGELGDLVRKGRREEFANFPEFQDPVQRERIPDPQAEETFRSGKLQWARNAEGVHGEWMTWYKEILAVRRATILPLLSRIPARPGHYDVLGESAVRVRWRTSDGVGLVLTTNLSEQDCHNVPEIKGRSIWREGGEQLGTTVSPWSVRWSLQDVGTGGR